MSCDCKFKHVSQSKNVGSDWIWRPEIVSFSIHDIKLCGVSNKIWIYPHSVRRSADLIYRILSNPAALDQVDAIRKKIGCKSSAFHLQDTTEITSIANYLKSRSQIEAANQDSQSYSGTSIFSGVITLLPHVWIMSTLMGFPAINYDILFPEGISYIAIGSWMGMILAVSGFKNIRWMAIDVQRNSDARIPTLVGLGVALSPYWLFMTSDHWDTLWKSTLSIDAPWAQDLGIAFGTLPMMLPIMVMGAMGVRNFLMGWREIHSDKIPTSIKDSIERIRYTATIPKCLLESSNNPHIIQQNQRLLDSI